ncbi:MAG: hypothetical protein IID45_06315 [Planctomycetes bacterium]|nr:hypothetical protein [Planctomycetota bacterium]
MSPIAIKHYNTLTIDINKLLTTDNRCKAVLIYVKGDCILNGFLSMDARGASASAVELDLSRSESGGAGSGTGDDPLFPDETNQPNEDVGGGTHTKYSSAAVGASGGAGGTSSGGPGSPGSAGGANQTGGGGGGGGTVDTDGDGVDDNTDAFPDDPSETTDTDGDGVGDNADPDDDDYLPYLRNERLVRPWAVPGTPGLEHRLGGLEKADITGNVEYSPANHQHMTDTRAAKIAGIADFIPPQEVEGPETGDVLVLSWGGTFGSVRTAVRRLLDAGKSVAHAHLRYLNPFPRNLGDVLRNYRRVLIPELNSGQLRFLIRGEFLIDAIGYNKVQGKPFLISEVQEEIEKILNQ